MTPNKQTLLILFIIQCLIGTLIGYLIYRSFTVMGTWCLFSILLVLSPERKDVMNLAVNRIKANLIGAAVGLLLFAIHPVNLVMICIGITIAVVICELLNLQAVTRSATVAVLIITIHEPGRYFWDVALERAGGTILGCVIGVLITYIFHIAILRSKRTIHKVKIVRLREKFLSKD